MLRASFYTVWASVQSLVLFSCCLMVLGAGFGFIASWIALRTPNVFAVAASHVVLGVLIRRVLEMSMRIGPYYARPDIHFLRHIIPLSGAPYSHFY